MKRIIPICLLTIFLFPISGFKNNSLIESPAKKTTEQFRQQYARFISLSKDLHKQANHTKDSKGIEELRALLLKTRNHYKSIEFLLAYAEPEFVKDWVNGAPLPHIERNSAASLVVLEPEGLQILDELIFGDEVLENIEEIREKAHVLHSKLNTLQQIYQNASPDFSEQIIFEAIRQEIIRILSLSITGFDTPMSGNALPETRIALQSLATVYGHFISVSTAEGLKIYHETAQLFEEADQYLASNQDFDSFDRMTFIRSFLNPLYANLLDVHIALGIPVREVIPELVRPINYKSKDIFSEEFINSDYFVKRGTSNGGQRAAELGRLLFFDPILSKNNERSCASCHQPQKGFTDGKAKSIAYNFEGTVDRNAPTVLNAIYADRLFHDLRSAAMESQIDHVIFEEREFNTAYLDIFDKLNQSKEYRQLFKEAFPKHANSPINKLTLGSAIAAYVKSLTSFNSPVDQYLRGEIEEVDETVRNGFNLFMGKGACATCHFAPTFNGSVPPTYTESESEVLGVLVQQDTLHPVLDPDRGRLVSKRLEEQAAIYDHSFKTPTVRNIALTAPYMHNGAYVSLEEVMDFYNRGGGVGMGLDIPNQTLPPDPLGLTKKEISDMISFMEALTDTVGLTAMPTRLPSFEGNEEWNKRKVGGTY